MRLNTFEKSSWPAGNFESLEFTVGVIACRVYVAVMTPLFFGERRVFLYDGPSTLITNRRSKALGDVFVAMVVHAPEVARAVNLEGGGADRLRRFLRKNVVPVADELLIEFAGP